MEILRTPDHRFAGLSAYPYASRTIALDEETGLRMAYVAEGAHENRPVVLLHGPPTWSYLWRGVIPMLIEGGCRAVAPDLVGFGRSDKPSQPPEHRRDLHVRWIDSLLAALEVTEATLVCHGAGALLALDLMSSAPAGRFNRAVFVSPELAAPRAGSEGVEPAQRGEPESADPIAPGDEVAGGCLAPLSTAARAGYDAPFPDAELAAGLRVQAEFLAGDADWALDRAPIELPIITIVGERGPRCDPLWARRLPGAGQRRLIRIPGGGHYLPEDRGAELGLALLSVLAGPA